MANSIKNLKWRNKFSGEEGYVKSISPKNGCFYNTFDKNEAKRYTNDTTIERDLRFLACIGEMTNNDFFCE